MLTDLKLKLMDFLSSHDVAGLSLLSACTADYNNRNDIGDEGAEIIKNMIYDFIHPSLDSTLPQVASATLLCGLDALTDIVLLADGDPISTWADQSGNGNNFTQTGIARPTKQTVGGYAAVVPDGVDDWMDGGNFAENLDVFSIIIVEHFGGHGGILMSKDEVDIDWNYNGWLIGNKAAIDLYQQPAPNDYRNLRQGASADPTNGLHVFGSEKISNTELHSYIDNALVDNFVPAIQSGATITSFTTSQTVKLFVEGGANGANDYGYSNTPLFLGLVHQVTDLTTWQNTDRPRLNAWSAFRYGILKSSKVGLIANNIIAVQFVGDAAAGNFATGMVFSVNAAPVGIVSAVRQSDHSIVHYTIDTAVIFGDVVTLDYGVGNIVSETTGENTPLGIIVNLTVVNNV